jgi:hypothetical protein
VDPDEALQQLRTAIRDYRDATSIAAADDAAGRLAEHVEALDGWLRGGGFLPAEWSRR